MRKCQQLHSDPETMAVMVWSGSATHPSNCTRSWCSKQLQNTCTIFGRELEVRRPRPRNWETDTFKRLGQIKHQDDHSFVHFTGPVIKPFHLEQRFPNCTLCTSIAPSVASHPTRGRSCHFGTTGARNKPLPPSIRVGNKRDGAVARDVLRNQEKQLQGATAVCVMRHNQCLCDCARIVCVVCMPFASRPTSLSGKG